ncbi:hypothetical protein DZC78_15730 [Olleya aquimaris]|uniref:Uncharacterized protein n=1 Tax=Olleya sediminilitoris TaxID=2795739 RepID=A0ABS1WL88_9FLAO|nr:DUF6428 family protein [Olleya sediminilitoris]AXO81770.1 hypothetical protein DZC78_15730 [Olleya aquimaris]MBL7559891.1 hypothetical protein [Olleya sediminilitoris]
MTLSEIKTHLSKLDTISFTLPDGSLVPSHFHVTEVGLVTKNFIDCGGTERQEKKVNFQLWNADDYDHRLHPEKLVNIIQLSENIFNLEGLDIEVEFQGEQTIQKFGIEFQDNTFKLTSLVTDCLAKDKCGIPEPKQKLQFSEIQAGNSCAPGSGCC